MPSPFEARKLAPQDDGRSVSGSELQYKTAGAICSGRFVWKNDYFRLAIGTYSRRAAPE